MDSPTPSLDFAIIGHQDSWTKIADFVNGIRKSGQDELPIDKIKAIYPYIPARDLFRVKVKSKIGTEINGVYIDTFIEPHKLNGSHIRSNIKKVIDAIEFAKNKGARMVGLGGFTSIVLEGSLESYSNDQTKFTTGNTLTAAYIVKGIERAASQFQIELMKSTVLIIGATGDIGMACVQYLKDKTGKLLLCARNLNRLRRLSAGLNAENVSNEYSSSLSELVDQADAIICVASSSGLKFPNFKKQVIICDAGYPKNLDTTLDQHFDLLFHGGMGQVSAGFEFYPDYLDLFYHYPAPNVIHGCILEAMILAFENKYEDYSTGKGRITVDKILEIYELGIKHGITMAPFFNTKGLC